VAVILVAASAIDRHVQAEQDNDEVAGVRGESG
jgi:hypothetical protein